MTAGIRAVIFDWAGTTVDHGSRAPIEAVRAVFRLRGIEVAERLARGPMGMAKLDHLRLLVAEPSIASAWERQSGRPPTEADVLAMYEDFRPLQLAQIESHGGVIDGVADVVRDLRARGIAIGSTTGYFREAAEASATVARRDGYEPDLVVIPDDVSGGRPAPWMMFRCMELLGVYPPASVVKVGDTRIDIEEARNAGTWAVGVAATGNEIGLSAPDLASLPHGEREGRLAIVREAFVGWGADDVVGSVADLLPAIDRLDALAAAGTRARAARGSS